MTPYDQLDAGVEGVLTDLYPGLLRFAAVVGNADTEPSDLVQEAVLRTIRLHPALDFDDPGAYLRRAILNAAKNQSRGAARHRLLMHRLVAEPTAAASFPSDLEDLLRLAPETRALLYLTVVDGHTHAEAAAIVGCTESAARARSSRGLRRLRAQLIEEVRND
ncbi:MAG TPA: sigma-70 family RNA polymerase sigma factor [Acidimicrobiia bacterium]